MASEVSTSETVTGKFWSWLPFTMILNFVLEGNPLACCRILAAPAPSISSPRKKYVSIGLTRNLKGYDHLQILGHGKSVLS